MKFSDLLNQKTVKRMKKNTTKHAKVNSKHTSAQRSKLASLRMNNMLTIDEAAKLCGVSKGIIHRWETTGMTPNDTMLSIKRYAKLLHINLQTLLKILQ